VTIWNPEDDELARLLREVRAKERTVESEVRIENGPTVTAPPIPARVQPDGRGFLLLDIRCGNIKGDGIPCRRPLGAVWHYGRSFYLLTTTNHSPYDLRLEVREKMLAKLEETGSHRNTKRQAGGIPLGEDRAWHRLDDSSSLTMFQCGCLGADSPEAVPHGTLLDAAKRAGPRQQKKTFFVNRET
jgi:hypothetical protein